MPKDFVGWADDTIKKMGVHSTTHIDAPWHYGPISYTDEGEKKAQTIDEMPLEKGFGPAVKIDMRHKQEGDVITELDVQEALNKTGSVITEGTIVLIQTGRDQFMGTKSFWKKGTGMSAEATAWLINKGCTVMGIDQWGWDLPFHYQIAQSKRDGNSDLFWEGHRIGQHKPYWQMEQLTNLESLPAHGFKVCVFPLKIVGASAAPARVVALFDGQENE
jgi:kynurenine formamidase